MEAVAEAALEAHVGPQRAERVEVRVEAAAADHVAAGSRHVGASEAREQWPGDEKARADALGHLAVHGKRVDVLGAERDDVVLAPRDVDPQTLEEADHRVHVADARDVADDHLLVGEETGGEGRQSRVLVAGGDDAPGERSPAFDDELLHAGGHPVGC